MRLTRLQVAQLRGELRVDSIQGVFFPKWECPDHIPDVNIEHGSSLKIYPSPLTLTLSMTDEWDTASRATV